MADVKYRDWCYFWDDEFNTAVLAQAKGTKILGGRTYYVSTFIIDGGLFENRERFQDKLPDFLTN